mmetsp:Transcript_108556/g.162382  ORF Transcript_108556/g.162382 Transcript_108556/m.162382 type:complete len:202 (-) Transcript_108556:449-1054(-)
MIERVSIYAGVCAVTFATLLFMSVAACLSSPDTWTTMDIFSLNFSRQFSRPSALMALPIAVPFPLSFWSAHFGCMYADGSLMSLLAMSSRDILFLFAGLYFLLYASIGAILGWFLRRGDRLCSLSGRRLFNVAVEDNDSDPTVMASDSVVKEEADDSAAEEEAEQVDDSSCDSALVKPGGVASSGVTICSFKRDSKNSSCS